MERKKVRKKGRQAGRKGGKLIWFLFVGNQYARGYILSIC